MEFYKIEFADGRFWFREDDGQEAVELTQEQLGLLLDRLSVMYHAGNLPLTLRKYVMMYYTNEIKEYVSLAECPSLVVCPERLTRKLGAGIEAEGVALTFLDGDEENRVMISIDSDVETRGVNILETWQMMEILTDGLNDAEVTDEVLLSAETKLKLSELKRELDNYRASKPEENMSEITWYWQKEDNNWQAVDWESEPKGDVCFDLPLSQGHLYLAYQADGTVILGQKRYPWQEKMSAEDAQVLWKALQIND